MRIYHINGTLLFEHECSTMSECIKYALKKNIDLEYANLSSQYLRFQSFEACDLSKCSFVGSTLRAVNFSGCDLSKCSFVGSTLVDVFFIRCNMADVRFTNSFLYHTNFYLCCLQSAWFNKSVNSSRFFHCLLNNANFDDMNSPCIKLSDNQLVGTSFKMAYLHHSTFERSDLTEADFSFADLTDANFERATLCDNTFDDAKGTELIFAKRRILPELGSAFIGWKKCPGAIVKLLIPANAKRSNAFGRKCRAEFVDVLEIIGTKVASRPKPRTMSSAKSNPPWGVPTDYEIGKRVTADKWDDNWQRECSNGIHFFLTREEAENY